MAAKLASELVLVCLAAAPPHRATPLRLMGATRPVEVAGVLILSAAVFTYFLSVDQRFLLVGEPDHSDLKPVFLLIRHFEPGI